jgi:hypothetical protein
MNDELVTAMLAIALAAMKLAGGELYIENDPTSQSPDRPVAQAALAP